MSDGTPWVFALALPIALLIDHFCGEPPPRWHPVVWMGNYLNRAAAHVLPVAPTAPEVRDLKLLALQRLPGGRELLLF